MVVMCPSKDFSIIKVIFGLTGVSRPNESNARANPNRLNRGALAYEARLYFGLLLKTWQEGYGSRIRKRRPC